MSAILSQVFTLPVQIVLAITVLVLILLYLLSIVWVNRDARQRGMSAVLWTCIAIIPVAGMVAYCLMRPSLMRDDIEEMDMEFELLHRQLEQFSDCPHCGYPTKPDYLVCPQCRKKLRSSCVTCGRPLNYDWTICPYCATPVQRAGSHRGARRSSSDSEGRSSRALREHETDGHAEAAHAGAGHTRAGHGKGDPFEAIG